MVAFTEDLSVFFALKADGGLADEATASWGGTVNVIFDNAYLAELGVAGTNPVALAKASDVSAARVGSTLTIAGTVYTIRNREPQDDGSTVLLQLEAA
ncbi:MAG: hypothetical protein EPO27_10600 [Betaproteobacteria bacterium]|nr:MAG: hypothetical protein EPO27_10600 [Betaproteobacteria bacterium]